MALLEDNPIQDLKNQIVDVFNATDPGEVRDLKLRELFKELDIYTPDPLQEVPYIFGLTIKRPHRK